MSSRRSRWLDPSIMVALVIIGTVSCLLRVPAAHHDIVWAEDANVFLFENLNLGPWAALFNGYAGYQHLVPRIASAGVIALAGVEQYAVVTFWTCALITGLIGAAVYWLSRSVLRWVPAQFAAALITFTLPLATQEVIGNFADIHTYFMWLVPWLIFSRPQSRLAASAWAIVAFAAMMTEVQAVLFLLLLPFFLRRPDRRAWPIFAALCAGAVWQIATVLTVERDSAAAWLGIPSYIQGWLINVPMPMAIADPASVRHHLQTSGLLIPAVIAMVFLSAYIVAVIWGDGRQRLLATTFLLASGAIYAAGATVDGSWWFRYGDGDAEIWDRILNVRYGVAAGMMLAGIVPITAAVLRSRARVARRAGGWLTGLAWIAPAAMVVTFAVASTQAISIRGWVEGPWSPAVRAAVVSCEAGSTTQNALPVAPERMVTLTCVQLTR